MPITSLGHQEGEVFSERRTNDLNLRPIVLKYVKHTFPQGSGKFSREALQLRACEQITLQMLENSCHVWHLPEV